MKTILAFVVTIGLLVGPAFAAGPVLNHCLFDWTMSAVPSNDLAGFNFYISGTAGGPYAALGTVPTAITGGGTNFSSPVNLCGAQSDGQKFVIVKAFDLAGNESVASAEAPFVLDVTAPSAVGNLKVR